MTLEQRIATWYDLGTQDYASVWERQQRTAEEIGAKRSGDIIYVSEHYPVVNFGQRTEHNKFSKKIFDVLGTSATKDDCIRYLAQQGIQFVLSSRGGGSTYIGPGQINFYPIVDLAKIPQVNGDIIKYKKIVDAIMFEVLTGYGLSVEIHNSDKTGVDVDRKDVWLTRDGRHYKLGGKGLKKTAQGVALHGFNFYVTKESTKGFEFIDPCGYTHEELGIISIEEAVGKPVDLADFKQRVIASLQKHLSYDKIDKK